MARRPSWMYALMLSLVLAVAASACSSASSQSAPAPAAPSSHAGSSPASSAPPRSTAPATPGQSATPTAMTSVVPVVVCRTTFGITPPPAPKTQPTSLTVSVPGGTGAELAVYTDDQGLMRLLAPRDWSCGAMYGADGSGGITVYPTGESVPSGWDAGWKLSASSPVQAVIGSQTSACYGCTTAQACPLFGSAAAEFKANFGRPCPAVRPAAETTAKLRPGVIAFADPPGVHGDGSPSGGSYPANGVMTFYPGNENGSWVETCTLPPARKGLCTAALDFFLNSYGNR